MNRKHVLLLLVATLVVAVAVPAFAREGAVAPTFDRKASKGALKKAKQALRQARAARRIANSALEGVHSSEQQARVAKSFADGAQQKASAAQAAAEGAQATADAAQAALEATKIVTGTASGSVGTASETDVSLEGGPSVTVTVPDSGLVEVWAQVTFEGEGAVTLYEDGSVLAGQTEFCAPDEAPALMAAAAAALGEPISLGTPSTFNFIGFACGTFGPPTGVLFQTTPGEHTYELRYRYCGCEEEVTADFSNRILRVAPRI